MARLGVVEKVVKELEREITCAICHDHYTEPKILPCSHYYCKQCIYKLALRTGMDKPFSCPECRKATTLPCGSVNLLPAAFLVNRMKEVYSKLEKAHGKENASCEMCSGAVSKAFCQQCAQLICTECIRQHQRMNVFAGHNIVVLDQINLHGSSDATMFQESPCKFHVEPMKIFCFQCNCLICRDCTIKAHDGHDYEFINIAAPEKRKYVSHHLESLKKINMNLSLAIEEVQSTKSEVKAQCYSVSDTIETSFSELQGVIEKRKQELLEEVVMKTTQKLEHLSSQEESLSTAFSVKKNVIEYTEKYLGHAADGEFMCIHDEIYGQVDREIKEQSLNEKSMEPAEEVDIGVEISCIEELKELCYTKTKITKLQVDPAKCTALIDGKRISEISKPCVLSLNLVQVLLNGKRSKQKCEVVCHLKSLVNDSIMECGLNAVKNNQYRIQYTPKVRGKHEIIVSVNDIEIAGSSFPIFVSIPPTLLGKPVRLITGLENPYGVAINSKGEITVTEYCGGGVVVLDEKGRKLKNLNCSDHNIVMPTGVAFDDTDNMYITGSKNCVIVKLNQEMHLSKKITTKQYSWPRGVTVVGDDVMVCDGKRDYVIVFNKELEYVRHIGSHGYGPGQFHNIIDISSDEFGNIYVIDDNDNSCIQVFTSRGIFLKSFGCDKVGVNHLKSPCGICVAGQYVYVTDSTDHNVLAYTTGGEYVTSFGQLGGKEGELRRPFMLCVDKNGYVHVCDYGNKRIQIF